MANIETKLNKFSAFVLEDALKQRDAMVDKFEKEVMAEKEFFLKL